MYYKASLDRLSKIVTIAIAILFVVIIVSTSIIPFPPEAGGTRVIFPMSAVFLTLTFILVFFFSTKGYELNGDAVIVKRVMGKVTLLRNDIESIQAVGRDELRGTLRTFGVGGLFGYYGKFYNSKIGKMTWYMTNTSNAVLIRMKDKKIYLISPDERDAFLKDSAH